MKKTFTTIFLVSAAILAAAVSATFLRKSEGVPSPQVLELKEKAAKPGPAKGGDHPLSDPLLVTLRKIPQREGVLVAGRADSKGFAVSKVFQSEVISQEQIKSQMEKLKARPRAKDSAAQR